MLMFTAKEYSKTEMCEVEGIKRHHVHRLSYGPSGQYRNPFMTAILDGAKPALTWVWQSSGCTDYLYIGDDVYQRSVADGTTPALPTRVLLCCRHWATRSTFCSSLCSVSPATRVSRFQSPLWVQRAQLSVWCRSWYRKVQQVETTSQSLLQCVCAGAVI